MRFIFSSPPPSFSPSFFYSARKNDSSSSQPFVAHTINQNLTQPSFCCQMNYWLLVTRFLSRNNGKGWRWASILAGCAGAGLHLYWYFLHFQFIQRELDALRAQNKQLENAVDKLTATCQAQLLDMQTIRQQWLQFSAYFRGITHHLLMPASSASASSSMLLPHHPSSAVSFYPAGTGTLQQQQPPHATSAATAASADNRHLLQPVPRPLQLQPYLPQQPMSMPMQMQMQLASPTPTSSSTTAAHHAQHDLDDAASCKSQCGSQASDTPPSTPTHHSNHLLLCASAAAAAATSHPPMPPSPHEMPLSAAAEAQHQQNQLRRSSFYETNPAALGQQQRPTTVSPSNDFEIVRYPVESTVPSSPPTDITPIHQQWLNIYHM